MYRLLLACVFLIFLGGCMGPDVTNSAFPTSIQDARKDLQRMHREPEALQRPLIVLSGFYDPGFVARAIARAVDTTTDDSKPIMHVSFVGATTFDACRKRVFERVNRELRDQLDPELDDPETQPIQVLDVDVIGYSMGGLVARYCAIPDVDTGIRLRVRRLFTISTPHRGAQLAPLAFYDARARDMQSGSGFLAMLDTALPDATYELFSYVRLSDAIVGPENASPPGSNPWWVPNKFASASHLWAGRDERILADIFRRLRGEDPLTSSPAKPVP